MTLRRDRFLEEMGLGPIWRLRQAGAPGPGIRDSGLAVEDAAPAPQRIAPAPVAQKTGTARRPQSRGIETGTGALALDERAERILKMDWTGLQAAVAGCEACPLHKTRRNTVFGVGDPRADWLIVGEAPGSEEDARGEPFVGQAGKLLDSMLAAIGLARGSNVYIANVLKCRPPSNRNPDPFEVAQCTPHLMRQLELIRPKIILGMGRFAVQALLDTEASIASLRGKVHRYRGVPLIVTYHPAYLLRSLPEKAKSWEDLCLARRTMAELR